MGLLIRPIIKVALVSLINHRNKELLKKIWKKKKKSKKKNPKIQI
jgi:hypothetical protein